ncbi:MAG: cysteine-rich CWC family protein [Sphingomonadales bacterium]|nr:cysteine-rich CWC family protein [Sphingomonadales bacterium]
MVNESTNDGCPACGGPVGCGMAKGEPTCWCMELPHAMPMPSAASAARCYCRTCLQKLIDDRATATPPRR